MLVDDFVQEYGYYRSDEGGIYGHLGIAIACWKETERALLDTQAKLARAMEVVKYCSLDEHAVFDGSAPNSCGSCRHPDCLSNEREWQRMRELVESLV